MYRHRLYLFIFILSNAFCFIITSNSYCQNVSPPSNPPQDTFFLAKKGGFWGRIGKSLSGNAPMSQASLPAVKNVSDFEDFKGETIHCIHIHDVSFGISVNDTNQVFRNFIINTVNHIHKPTKEGLIQNNLFFKEGDALNPNTIAENVRYLRSLPYLQDARIEVVTVPNTLGEVDVEVFYKDVFSFAVVSSISNNALFVELRDNNIMGTGQQLTIQNLYDPNRSNSYGGGVQYLKRNIGGSLANLSLGYQNVAGAYSDGRRDETYAAARVTLPLVSPYYSWTGEAEIAKHFNQNKYVPDSVFKSDDQYDYNNFDTWVGYNVSKRYSIDEPVLRRVKHFVALRLTDLDFTNIPNKYKLTYNSQYASIKSVLGAYTFFKQEYYHSSFIYGFGRNEDVPEGYNISFIGGWTDKNNIQRPYAGINIEDNYFTKKKNYFDYVLKVGGYYGGNTLQDFSSLLQLQTFTRLRRLGNSTWFLRHFFSGSVVHQFNRLLDAPLVLNSMYGIPQFSGDSTTQATSRATLNCESIFYNTWKLVGFSFAPFVFTNFSFLKTDYINGGNSFGSNIDGYVGSGFGVRTRNENLVFGTIELRFFYFPKTVAGMSPFSINISSNLIFAYNSRYVVRPDFVSFN
jgi:hypothetical protein